MKTYQIINIGIGVAVAALALVGCQMSSQEFAKWQELTTRENAQLQRMIAEQDERLAELNHEKEVLQEIKRYYQGQVGVLEQESTELEATWEKMRRDSLGVMTNLMLSIQDYSSVFCDVRLGRPAKAMNAIWKAKEPTLIVDMGRVVKDDCHINAVEIYVGHHLDPKDSNAFYAAIFRPEPDGSFSVRSVSNRLVLADQGLNFIALKTNPLEAKRGDRYGLFLERHTGLDYTSSDTGLYLAKPLATMPQNLLKFKDKFAVPEKRGDSQGKASMEFAFSLLGMTDSKYLFMLDDGRTFDKKTQLTQLTVTFRNDAVADASHNAYFIVLTPGKKDVFSVRSLSPRFHFTAGTTRFDLSQDGSGSGMTVEPGDVCALVLVPGTPAGEIASASHTYRMFECDFTPSHPQKTLPPATPVTADPDVTAPELIDFLAE